MWLGWVQFACLFLLGLSGFADANILSFSTWSLPWLWHHPTPPKYPDSYEISYNVTLPYVSTYQKGGLVYSVQVWKDAGAGKMRMDMLNGINSIVGTKELELEVTPRLTELYCQANIPDPEEDEPLVDSAVLPDLTAAHWNYKGDDLLGGRKVKLWEYRLRSGDKVTVYKFFVKEDGTPVQLAMLGHNFFSGDHFDEYVADFHNYKPGKPDPKVFDRQDACQGVEPDASKPATSLRYRMMSILPALRLGGRDLEYDSFAQAFGRRHASPAEYEHRRSVFRKNLETIQRVNEAGNDLTLTVNRFADWTKEEYMRVMLPKHGRPRPQSKAPSPFQLPHQPLLGDRPLPRAVSWRGTLGDAPVVDQADCGSCWAFGASGALQGAYFLATGAQAHFSEQHIMDCSWGYGYNMACDGGDYDKGLDYLIESGGAVLDSEYEYLGVDNFCLITTAPRTKIKGYVFVPPGDDAALMEALVSRGPIAVSIDASPDSYSFYSSGVIDDPLCKWKNDDLDHAVTLVGYGTTSAGKDYWLVRNSWSSHWGDDGYFKVVRGHKRDCGVTTVPMYAVLDLPTPVPPL